MTGLLLFPANHSFCLRVFASLREPHLFFLAKAQKRKGDFE